MSSSVCKLRSIFKYLMKTCSTYCPLPSVLYRWVHFPTKTKTTVPKHFIRPVSSLLFVWRVHFLLMKMKTSTSVHTISPVPYLDFYRWVHLPMKMKSPMSKHLYVLFLSWLLSVSTFSNEDEDTCVETLFTSCPPYLVFIGETCPQWRWRHLCRNILYVPSLV